MAIPKLLDVINRGRLDSHPCRCESIDSLLESGWYYYEGLIDDIASAWFIQVNSSDSGRVRQEATTVDANRKFTRHSSNGGSSWTTWSMKPIRESLGIYTGTKPPEEAIEFPREGDIYVLVSEESIESLTSIK